MSTKLVQLSLANFKEVEKLQREGSNINDLFTTTQTFSPTDYGDHNSYLVANELIFELISYYPVVVTYNTTRSVTTLENLISFKRYIHEECIGDIVYFTTTTGSEWKNSSTQYYINYHFLFQRKSDAVMFKLSFGFENDSSDE